MKLLILTFQKLSWLDVSAYLTSSPKVFKEVYLILEKTERGAFDRQLIQNLITKFEQDKDLIK